MYPTTKDPQVPGTNDKIFSHDKFTATLTVRNGDPATPTIHVKTFLENLAYSTNDYPRARVYQSAVWPEALRETKHVSVAIGLGNQSALEDRIAMNHTLTGLMTYLDAASKIKSLNIRLLDGHHHRKAELVETLQPVTIWVRCRSEVAVKLVDIAGEVKDVLVQVGRSHSRSDETIERLYGAVRMAARAAGQLNQAGRLTRIAGLNHEMAKIMTDVGFVGSTSRMEVELATEQLEVVLACLIEEARERCGEKQGHM